MLDDSEEWKEMHDIFYFEFDKAGALRTPKRELSLPLEAFRMTLLYEEFNNRKILPYVRNSNLKFDEENEENEEKLPKKILEQMLGTNIPKGPKLPYYPIYDKNSVLYGLYTDGQGKIRIDYTGELANILGFTDLDITNKNFYLPAKPGGWTNIVTHSANRAEVAGHEESHNRELDPHTYLTPSNAAEESAVESYRAGFGA